MKNLFSDLKKTDLIAPLIIGELISLILIGISKNLQLKIPFLFLAPFILPFLFLVGVLVAFLLVKKIGVLFQFAKFAVVGSGNTLVDLGILNFLIWLTNIASGFYFSLFKFVSFTGAVLHSYFWNKFWTFEKKEKKEVLGEFSKFYLITGVGALLNVGIASFLVNIIGSQFGLSAKMWANVAAILAALVVMIWNFTGYKFIVFKK
jgi:putative flippase GtrA